MNGPVRHGDDLVRLGRVLRRMVEETRSSFDTAKSEEIFRSLMVTLERRRRRWDRRLAQALQVGWRQLKSTVLTFFQPA
jgi:hypothetical protein